MTKLEKLRLEYEKAKEIAEKITEEEKTVIHEMMTSANMTPEELGQLLERINRHGEEAFYETE